MRIYYAACVVLSALSLAGCQTLQGLQNDLSSLGAATSNKLSSIGAPDPEATGSSAPSASGKSKVVTNTDSDCPPIVIDPQLDSMSEFTDLSKPSDDTLMSRVALTSAISACNITAEHIEMRLDLTFNGTLGPEAKRKDSDRPFFAYPYFVRVTDDEDTVLAEEIFAASVTYEADQDSIKLIETINQKLPLNDDGTIPPYKIHVGFQLTEEQLFYNASH